MKILDILKTIKHLNHNYYLDTNKLYKQLANEIEKELSNQKNDILKKICDNYNLDINKVKKKILKNSIKNSNVNSLHSALLDIESEKLLYKFQLDNKNYYVECIENGKIYDENKNIVGIIKNSSIIFNK